MPAIYNFHPTTGEYLTQSEASLDPVAGQPLVPAFATLQAPPVVRINEAAVFDDDIWSIVADFRGTEYWLNDGSLHVVSALGDLVPNNALDTPPLSLIKEKANTNVYAFTTATRVRVTGDVDRYKLAGWADKFQRAQRVLAGSASEYDNATLQAESDQRGLSETPAVLAALQVAKGEALASSVANIDGMEHAALQAITEAVDEAEVTAAYDALVSKAEAQLVPLY